MISRTEVGRAEEWALTEDGADGGRNREWEAHVGFRAGQMVWPLLVIGA